MYILSKYIVYVYKMHWLHPFSFISIVANCQLVSDFRFLLVGAYVACLGLKKWTSVVAYFFSLLNQFYESKFSTSTVAYQKE